MGRKSLKAKTQKIVPSQVADAREAAVEAMNDALRAKFEYIEQRAESQEEDNLRYNYTLGTQLIEIESDPRRYQSNALTLLSRAMFIRRRAMREAMAFAREFTPDELEELISLKREDVGFSLHYGHVRCLLALSDKAKRRMFMLRAVEALWSPKDLRDKIKKELNTPNPHGRTMTCPKTLSQQISQVHEQSRQWLEKYENVWNGDTTVEGKHNVFANVLEAVPDQVSEDDLEKIDEIAEYFQKIQTACKESNKPIKQLREHVAACLAAQALHEQDDRTAAPAEAAAGRQRRHVDLGDDGDEVEPDAASAADRARSAASRARGEPVGAE